LRFEEKPFSYELGAISYPSGTSYELNCHSGNCYFVVGLSQMGGVGDMVGV